MLQMGLTQWFPEEQELWVGFIPERACVSTNMVTDG